MKNARFIGMRVVFRDSLRLCLLRNQSLPDRCFHSVHSALNLSPRPKLLGNFPLYRSGKPHPAALSCCEALPREQSGHPPTPSRASPGLLPPAFPCAISDQPPTPPSLLPASDTGLWETRGAGLMVIDTVK